jgi:sigma-B regulation protein RsbQ
MNDQDSDFQDPIDHTLSHAFLNEFCSGHLVLDSQRKIVYCNAYIGSLSKISQEALVGESISTFFTKASNIFLDTYVYPILLHEKLVTESQMSWLSRHGEVVPVMLNIKLGQNGMSYWSLFICAKRDKLHTELTNTKEELKAQSESLYELATTDPLTGLLNRRELLAQAENIASQMDRNSSFYAVLTLDVDFFKKVNDTHGHQAGDKVLIQLAKVLLRERRANDLVARVGGEEFVIVLPDVDEESAFLVAEKIRINVAEQVVDGISITMSIGGVVSEQGMELNFDNLLALSDNALLSAKKTGRNKTTMGSASKSF